MDQNQAEEALWQAVLRCQGEHFFTSSGLPFTYEVKRKKNGEYSGELLISRKEVSKTLTKSSVMYAFRKVFSDGKTFGGEFTAPEYKGPKEIGQIFGISYSYSLFWRLGLIRVPEKVEKKLKGENG